MTYWIILWLVVCPVCKWTTEIRSEPYYSMQGQDANNLIKCGNPMCSLVLWAKPKRITKTWEEIVPTEEKESLYCSIKKHEEVVYESNADPK